MWLYFFKQFTHFIGIIFVGELEDLFKSHFGSIVLWNNGSCFTNRRHKIFSLSFLQIDIEQGFSYVSIPVNLSNSHHKPMQNLSFFYCTAFIVLAMLDKKLSLLLKFQSNLGVAQLINKAAK